jgi:hypothetical protein
MGRHDVGFAFDGDRVLAVDRAAAGWTATS